MNNFKFVSLEQLNKELRKREKDRKSTSRKQFLAFDSFSGTYLAVDNRSLDFFIEEFKTHDEAMKWLNQY
jgi:hypothetical protein